MLVADSGYSGVEFLGAVADQPNMVSVVRVATNRVFYRPAPPVAGPRKGHPRWYGERFELGDPSSWGVPDETAETTWQTGRGRTYRVRLQAWRPLLLRGSRAYAMHRHPVTLIRAEVFDEQGKAAVGAVPVGRLNPGSLSQPGATQLGRNYSADWDPGPAAQKAG